MLTSPNNFLTFPYVILIPAILVFLLSILLLIIVVTIILLDNLHRPNISQYPFNLFLDRIIPLIALISPSMIVYFLLPSTIPWISRLGTLLLIHIFILIPLFMYWSRLRKWNLDIYVPETFNLWKHPSIFFYISVGMVYPTLWGLYFSFLRFIRMGYTLDLNLMQLNVDLIIICVFLLPYLFLWFSVFLYLFKSMRIELWDYTSKVLYSFHLGFLQNHFYFMCLKFLHKFHFFLFDIFVKNLSSISYIDYHYTILKITSYIYRNAQYLNIIFFSCLFLELYITSGKLYYGIYLLFLYPLIIGILHCFNSECISNFIQDVCLSDYLYKRWLDPRYPNKFWSYAGSPEYWYGFSYDYSVEEFVLVQKLHIDHCSRISKQSFNILRRTWGQKYISNHKLFSFEKANGRIPQISRGYTIYTGNPRSWALRFKASYYGSLGVRWTHTGTALAIKNSPFGLLALLTQNGGNYNLIQKVSKNIIWPSNTDLYSKIPSNIFLDPNKHFVNVVENNLIMSFQTLARKSVLIGTYYQMKNKFTYSNLETNQLRPDVLLRFANSSYIFQGYLGIDHKSKNVTNYGKNQILTPSNITYYEILQSYRQSLIKKGILITEEMDNGLTDLLNTANDFENHQDIYGTILQWFPEHQRPPIFINPSFQEKYFNQETLDLLNLHRQQNLKISNLLYEKKIPELSNLSDEALNAFNGSYIQSLFKET